MGRGSICSEQNQWDDYWKRNRGHRRTSELSENEIPFKRLAVQVRTIQMTDCMRLVDQESASKYTNGHLEHWQSGAARRSLNFRGGGNWALISRVFCSAWRRHSDSQDIVWYFPASLFTRSSRGMLISKASRHIQKHSDESEAQIPGDNCKEHNSLRTIPQ